MTSTIENIKTATNLIQFVGGQLSRQFGGPLGQAAANYLLGQPGLVVSFADLIDKIDSGTATPNDVADVLYDAAQVLAGVGVLAGVASPVLLTAVGIAGAVLFINENFGDALIDLLTVQIDEIAQSAKHPVVNIQGAIDSGLLDAHTLLPKINPTVNANTTSARNWTEPRRDPLVLDLDGGGITTSGINPNAPILFDQDGDGIKTASGWIASGEAIVVRDINGNGSIDSGRELFGDSTVLTRGPRAGQTAANGFEALADLDSNGDGQFNSRDAAFASVKLWKDLNQNGVSEANELFSFEQLGVASIQVSGQASGISLGGANHKY